MTPSPAAAPSPARARRDRPALPRPSALPRVPARLPAPAPGWVEHTDVVVVGSGIAGLTTALYLREAGLHVTVVTKVNVDDGSTRWAQGGIAAVLDRRDTASAHAADTFTAGAGLCQPAAVRVLVDEGPARVRELIRFGAAFDRDADGQLALTREGGHRADRVAHAGGDATGAEVQRALQTVVRDDPWIRLVEHAVVVDLLTSGQGRACGVTLHVLGEGTPDGVGAVLSRAVVLATGGSGQVFDATTNPTVATGDGVALALRAGATVTDLEFVQFHPTALAVLTPDAQPRPLVSEALRGEGAHLVDGDGVRFMTGRHELAELAPRDVVARAAHEVMTATSADHVLLDARHLGAEFLERRFPTVLAGCRAAGIDPVHERIPVAPAAHYTIGGVRTDLSGRSQVPGLYACGEVACTGVHGANRLASNSLLEGLVFARRIARDLVRSLPRQEEPADGPADGPVRDAAGGMAAVPDWAALRGAMGAGAGVRRSADSLDEAAGALAAFTAEGTDGGAEPQAWETANVATVAAALVGAAFARQESRGCHWRTDRPGPERAWRGRVTGAVAADGSLTFAWEHV